MVLLLTALAWLALLWSTLSFASSVLRHIANRTREGEISEALCIGWLAASALLFLSAGMVR